MIKFIRHLRRQPEEARRHLLHILTFIFAAILILIWSLSLGKSLADPKTKKSIKEDFKSFSVLKDDIFSIDNKGVLLDSNAYSIDNR